MMAHSAKHTVGQPLAVAKKKNFPQNLLEVINNRCQNMYLQSSAFYKNYETVLVKDCFWGINNIAKLGRTHF